ncbi:MAG: magnesium transporter [Pseudomonadota bacterium]
MELRQEKTSTLKTLRGALDTGAMRRVRRTLDSLHPSEIARLLESLPQAERQIVWDLLEREYSGEVLVELSDDVRGGLIEQMGDDELVAAAEGMELDDLADLLTELPETVTRQVLTSLDQADRERLRTVLAYDEDSAGGLMDPNTISVRPDVPLEVVLRYLRMQGELPDGTDQVFVVDRNERYLGVLKFSSLLTSDPDIAVSDVMDRDSPSINVDMPDVEVSRIFEDRDLFSAAVVDEQGRLIGRITIDDVVDVIRDEAEHSIMSAAGLDEENDLFAPVLISAKRRAVWLGVNLATAFLAAYVVDMFQTTIDKVVLMAVLMPVVPSMGGVAGTQSLTIITRALALGQIETSNAVSVLKKEVSVGLINGVIWAAIVALVTLAWFKTPAIGAIVGAALMINMIVAAAAGYSLPLLMRRLGWDPALGGGVVLTTITDVVGYGVFLGLGALFLL